MIPVTYGDGVAERIRGPRAAASTRSSTCSAAATSTWPCELGVAPDRINTIVDSRRGPHRRPDRGQHGRRASATVLAELAELVAAGELEVRSPRATRSTEVRDAYRELERRHTRGKIVLRP